MTDSMDQDQILSAILAREAADRVAASPSRQRSEPEQLLDLLRGTLSKEQEEDLRANIIADPEASRRLLDLEALVRDGDQAAADPTGDLAAAAGWRALQGKLPAAASDPSRPAAGSHFPNSAAPPGAERSSPFWLQPVAAMLLLSTVGLSILLLQRPPARLPGSVASVANLQTLELASGLRSGTEIPPVVIAPEEPISLLLDPTESCPLYRLTVTGPAGTTTLEGLHRETRGGSGVLVALVTLPPGSYTAILEGCSPLNELERYTFQLQEGRGSEAPKEGAS